LFLPPFLILFSSADLKLQRKLPSFSLKDLHFLKRQTDTESLCFRLLHQIKIPSVGDIFYSLPSALAMACLAISRAILFLSFPLKSKSLYHPSSSAILMICLHASKRSGEAVINEAFSDDRGNTSAIFQPPLFLQIWKYPSLFFPLIFHGPFVCFIFFPFSPSCR